MNDFIKHYLLCEGYEKTYNAITKKPAKADQEISALLTVESDSERSAVRKVIESLPIRKQFFRVY